MLLHFFRRAAGPLRDDLHVIVGHVRIRFDRQAMERDRAPGQQKYGQRQHHEAVVQREIDEALHLPMGYCLLVHGILENQRVANDLLTRLHT